MVRAISKSDNADNPFQGLREIRSVSLDGNGSVLFVTGTISSTILGVAIAAFDISSDSSNPTHLDTWTGLHFDDFPVGSRPRSLLHSTLGQLGFCDTLLPHTGRSAVDVFCQLGFLVVAWNPASEALELADLAVAGAADRFGNVLPYNLGFGWDNQLFDRRQMAQSPDGAHAYRATRVAYGELSDAIHVFERAIAMTPVETGGETGSGETVTEGTDPADGVDGMPETGMQGDCYVGLLVGIGESCTYPGTTDEFSVNVRGRGRFLDRLAGIRIRINNETINGRVYDFEASHQGDGVWRIDRVAGMM